MSDTLVIAEYISVIMNIEVGSVNAALVGYSTIHRIEMTITHVTVVHIADVIDIDVG